MSIDLTFVDMVADRPLWWLAAAAVVGGLVFVLRLVEVFARPVAQKIAFRACGLVTAVVLLWGAWVAASTTNPLVWLCWYVAAYVLLRIGVHLLVRLADARFR